MTNTTIKGKAPYLSQLIGFKHENSKSYANLKFTNGKVMQLSHWRDSCVFFINNKSRTCSSVGYRHGSCRLSCPWQQTLYRLFLIPNYYTLLYIEHLQIPHNEENEIIFIDWLIFLSNYSYLSGKCINFASKITDWLSYSWCQTIREFYNMLKISALRAYKAETHNLEVPGSSPGWSTLKEALKSSNSWGPFLFLFLFGQFG